MVGMMSNFVEWCKTFGQAAYRAKLWMLFVLLLDIAFHLVVNMFPHFHIVIALWWYGYLPSLATTIRVFCTFADKEIPFWMSEGFTPPNLVPKLRIIEGKSSADLDFVARFGWILAAFNVIVMSYLIWAKPKKVYVLPKEEVSDVPVLEKFVEGSHYRTARMPPFQARVYVQLDEDGEFLFSGNGFQTDAGFVTAFHVILDALKVKIMSPGYNTVVSVEEFKQVERLGDVALLNRRILGLKTAKLSHEVIGSEGNKSVMVMIHNGEICSLGNLREYEDFGQVWYHGSTSPGFSGAPYYFGNVVYGMHLAAGAVNFGYESAYLNLMIRSESSEDYFLDKIRDGRAHKWKISPGDPDEILVKMNGRMVIVDRYAYHQALAERDEHEDDAFNPYDPEENVGSRHRRKKRSGYRYIGLESYRDHPPPAAPASETNTESSEEEDQGNASRPAVVVQTSAGPSTQEPVSNTQKLKKRVSSKITSQQDQKDTKLQNVTVPPESTHAQSGSVSATTSERTKKRSQNSRLQHQIKLLKEQLRLNKS